MGYVTNSAGMERVKQHFRFSVGATVVGKVLEGCSPSAFEVRLQPTMRSIDSSEHFYTGTPVQWADLVKYVSVLTAHSP